MTGSQTSLTRYRFLVCVILGDDNGWIFMYSDDERTAL
jgi:hypothetical protein